MVIVLAVRVNAADWTGNRVGRKASAYRTTVAPAETKSAARANAAASKVNVALVKEVCGRMLAECPLGEAKVAIGPMSSPGSRKSRSPTSAS
jgi:hypothetical protein